MNQNTKDKQNYAFSVTIENTATGESEVLQLPSTKEKTAEVFNRLKISRRYRIKNCDYPIAQIREALERGSNLDELNFCAAELLKCDEDKIDFIWQILEAGCDRVDCPADIINLLHAAPYSFYRIRGITTYEQVCEFHLAAEQLKSGFIPVAHIQKESYAIIGKEFAHAERGGFACGNYLARTKNYYPDIYFGGDSFPFEYRIVP